MYVCRSGRKIESQSDLADLDREAHIGEPVADADYAALWEDAENGEAEAARIWQEWGLWLPVRPPSTVAAVRRAVRTLRALAEQTKFARPVDYKVMLALLDISHRCIKLEVNASVRSLGIEVGATRNTVSRSLKRLQQAGWIERIPQEDKPVTEAALFALLDPRAGGPNGDIPSLPMGQVCIDQDPPSVDALSGQHARWRVLHLMQTESRCFTKAELVRRSNVSLTTVKRALRQFIADGLVEHTSQGFRATDARAINIDAGALQGKSARRAQAYQKESELWKEANNGKDELAQSRPARPDEAQRGWYLDSWREGGFI